MIITQKEVNIQLLESLQELKLHLMKIKSNTAREALKLVKENVRIIKTNNANIR